MVSGVIEELFEYYLEVKKRKNSEKETAKY